MMNFQRTGATALAHLCAAMPQSLTAAAGAALVVACASDSRSTVVPPLAPQAVTPTMSAVEDEDEDEVTGKSLYARHCAGCHNENGDGRGATMLSLGKEARSFAQGGFAFGNTADAIYKTITSGMPGTSLMPAFNAALDDDERRLVADYVLTLMPRAEHRPATESVMAVGERALFAYGKLPSLREGLPERPRGLMVGLPGGASFEFRIDDVRLLAMRRGGFVDRTDWNERGGGVLLPLGGLAAEIEGGDPKPWILAGADSAQVPIELALSAARITGDLANEVELELLPKSGPTVGLRSATVTCFQPKLSGREGFGRRIRIEASSGEAQLGVLLHEADSKDIAFRSSSVSDNPQWRRVVSIRRRGDGFEYTNVECLGELRWSGDRLIWTPLATPATGGEAHVIVVPCDVWDEALVMSLDRDCRSQGVRQ